MNQLANQTIAVTGAKNSFGHDILNVMAERSVDYKEIIAIDNQSQPGDQISFGDHKRLDIVKFDKCDLKSVDVLINGSQDDQASSLLSKFRKANPDGLFIDGSGALAMEPDVSLVVPEVNGKEVLSDGVKTVSVPGSLGTFLSIALKPLQDQAGLKRVTATAMQSVGHHGRAAQDELFRQTKSAFMGGGDTRAEHLPKSIAFNLLPQSSPEREDGQSSVEWQSVSHLKKLLGAKIGFAVTAVQAPVFVGDMIAVTVETEKEATPITVQMWLSGQETIGVIDEPEQYPTPAEITGDDLVYICRIRHDPSVDNGIQFIIVADGLRKGRALNVVNVLEHWFSGEK